MFKNISAFMENLGPSQSAFYLIKEWNKARNNTSLSLGAFVNVHSMPVSTCLFSYKLSAFMSSYQGVLISTTVKNAAISLKMPTKMDRYLYLWDFEWTKGKPSYSSICEVLRNDKLKIITRSDDHARMVENFCNKRPVGIVDNWNLKQIESILGLGDHNS